MWTRDEEGQERRRQGEDKRNTRGMQALTQQLQFPSSFLQFKMQTCRAGVRRLLVQVMRTEKDLPQTAGRFSQRDTKTSEDEWFRELVSPSS